MLRTILLARGPQLSLLHAAARCKVATHQVTRAFLASTALQYVAPGPATPAPTPPAPVVPSPAIPSEPVDHEVRELAFLLREYRRTQAVEQAIQSIQSSRLAPCFQSSASLLDVFSRLVSQRPAMAPPFLQLVHEMGHTLPPDAFETAYKHLQYPRDRLALTDAYLEQHGPCDVMIRRKAKALVFLQQWDELQGLEEKYPGHINAVTFQHMIVGALRNSNLARAQDLLQRMRNLGLDATEETNAVITRTYYHLGAEDAVEEWALSLLENMRADRQVSVLNGLLRGHMERNDIRRARRLLSLFEPKSVEIITEVISGSDGGRFDSFDPLSFPPPLRHPPYPNASTYHIFFHSLKAQKDFSKVIQLLHCMMSQGIPPSMQTIAILIQTCFRCGRPDLAVQLAASATGNASKASLRAFRRIHQGEWPRQGFEVHVPNAKPSAHVFNALLEGILDCQGFDGGRTVMDLFAYNKVIPNERTLDHLLNHLRRRSRAGPRTLIRVLYEFTGPHLRATEHHVGIIVSAIQDVEQHAIHGHGWNALKFKRPKDAPEELRPTGTANFDDFAGILLPTFRGYARLMRPFLDDLRARDVKPNAATIALRIRHEAIINQDMSAANSVFREMLRRGISATPYHYSILAEGYALQGDIKNVNLVLQSAQENGLTLTAFHYTALINAYAYRREPSGCLQAFQRMVEAGVRPDVPAVDAVIRAFYAIGKNAKAKALLYHLWAYVGIVPEDLVGRPELGIHEMRRRFYEMAEQQGKFVPHKLSEEEQRNILGGLASFMKHWQYPLPRNLRSDRKRPWREIISPKNGGTPQVDEEGEWQHDEDEG